MWGEPAGAGGGSGREGQPQTPPVRHRCPTAQLVPPHTHFPVVQTPAAPALQEASDEQAHVPEVHPNPVGQACPQAPQLCGSLARFRHPAGFWQHVASAAHDVAPLHVHTSEAPAFAQTSPEWQAWPAQLHSPVTRLHVPPPPPSEQAPFDEQPHWFFGLCPPSHTSPPPPP